MAAFLKFKFGDVASSTSGQSFNITSLDGVPLLSITFRTAAEANAAKAALAVALADAVEITHHELPRARLGSA